MCPGSLQYMDTAFRDPVATITRHGLRPRKSMGQNFLRDAGAARAIIDALPEEPPRLVEVGAGPGTMTRALGLQREQVAAVELDPALVPLLRRETRDLAGVTVVEGDALKVDIGHLLPAPYAVFGNIPYHITGELLPRLLSLDPMPAWVAVLVQLEVAERLCAEPGDWSLATLAVRTTATAELLVRVPAPAFEPIPKVDSALVLLRPHRREAYADAAFFDLARAVFQERRKKLSNAVANALAHDVARGRRVVEAAGLDQMRRPQTLDLEEWRRLYAAFQDEVG
jgi:16S rRNA (adenine1518-N6/adenine1519-N6)-dimethyltransferase